MNPTDASVVLSVLASQAQHLLQQTGWAYYTIWSADYTHPLPGLVWSTGEVNDVLVANADNNLNNGCCHVGLLLQKFYELCRFLPCGSGSMVGETFASGQYRWASGGEELLMQLTFLNSKSQRPVPLELQAVHFKTIVCIPLQKGAGVLELGTKELVPENDIMPSQILQLFDGLSCQNISRVTSPAFEAAGTGFLQANDVGDPYDAGPVDEHHKKETYGHRDFSQHPSTSSSLHWSLSYETSPSTPRSANDQSEDSSNTSQCLLRTTSNLMNPTNTLQTTSTSVLNSLTELHVLKQLEYQIDMQDVDTPNFLQELDGCQLSESHQHVCVHNEGNSVIDYLFDHMLQPAVQRAFIGSEHASAHHSLDELVAGQWSVECSRERQTNTSNQLQEPSISCLPSTSSQLASHLISCVSHQHQQWGPMFSSGKEGRGMTDFFRQSKRDLHAMAAMDIHPADGSQEANFGHDTMPQHDAALAMVDESSTSKNRRLVTRAWSVTSEGEGPIYIKDEMSTHELAFTNQAVHASGSADSDKVAGSTPSAGSHVNYYLNVPEDYRVAGTSVGSHIGSHASDSSAGAYRVVDSRTSHPTGSFYNSASGSAEVAAGKVIGTSSQGADCLPRDIGDRDEALKRAQAGTGHGGFLDRHQLQGAHDYHHHVIAPSFASTAGFLKESKVVNFAEGASPSQIEAAVQHMYAERDRRRKQAHCMDTLRTLVPTVTKKHSKVAILESTIHHLKELKEHVCELEQENATLRLLNVKDKKRELAKIHTKKPISNKKNRIPAENLADISSQESANCHYIDSTSDDNRDPHFQLSLIKNAKDVTVNTKTIEILESLQARNFCCYKIDHEFSTTTSKVCMNILASYKDGGNYNPSLTEIEDIKEWWRQLNKH